jgi:aspartate kinase
MAGGFFICPQDRKSAWKKLRRDKMNGPSEASSEAASQRSECVVMKFGGTSVEDAAAIQRLCRLVARPSAQRRVVVVSALAKGTDQLMNAGWAAAAGQLEAAREVLQGLRQRHETVARGLAKGNERRRLFREIATEFKALDKMLLAIVSEKALTPRSQDRLLGVGESLSSRLVHCALQSAGIAAALVDARECIVTDAAHTRATPLWEETNQRLQAVLFPLLDSGQVPVMGGFVGATRDGIPTTLGRGGSDFTASIVGAGVHAQRIEIWTDVDGIMTTDPNLCPDARRVPRMSFDEAADLAYFGAKVLHPATLVPAMRSNIPVWVLNSRNPDCAGTEILAHCDSDGVKAITAKRGVAIVDVEPVRWFAPELLREVFDVFERHQHSLDLLSASRGSLALLVSSVSDLPAIAEELKGMANVRWENHKALVCLVGEQVRRRPELASQAYRALGDIEMRMICQGASERNISFLVNESRAEEAVQRLHRAFFSKAEPAVAHRDSRSMCQAEGAWHGAD